MLVEKTGCVWWENSTVQFDLNDMSNFISFPSLSGRIGGESRGSIMI